MGNAIVEMFIRAYLLLLPVVLAIGLVMLGALIAWLGYSEIVLHPNGVAPL